MLAWLPPLLHFSILAIGVAEVAHVRIFCHPAGALDAFRIHSVQEIDKCEVFWQIS